MTYGARASVLPDGFLHPSLRLRSRISLWICCHWRRARFALSKFGVFSAWICLGHNTSICMRSGTGRPARISDISADMQLIRMSWSWIVGKPERPGRNSMQLPRSSHKRRAPRHGCVGRPKKGNSMCSAISLRGAAVISATNRSGWCRWGTRFVMAEKYQKSGVHKRHQFVTLCTPVEKTYATH